MSGGTAGPWVQIVLPTEQILADLVSQGARQVAVVAPAPGGYVDADEGRAKVLCVALCGDPDAKGESEANARLIAAAPDLLAACITAVESLDAIAYAATNGLGSGLKDETEAHLLAAIAKAHGEATR